MIATRFFVDYGLVPTPAVANRDPNPLTLTFAGRCMAVAGGTVEYALIGLLLIPAPRYENDVG